MSKNHYTEDELNAMADAEMDDAILQEKRAVGSTDLAIAVAELKRQDGTFAFVYWEPEDGDEMGIHFVTKFIHGVQERNTLLPGETLKLKMISVDVDIRRTVDADLN